jgi:hypothetical protein
VTRQDGRYSFRVPNGTTIVRIEYDHPQWHPRFVEELSAQAGDDQIVNKVLPNRNGPERFDVIIDQLATYERFYVLGIAQGMSRAQLLQQYGGRIVQIPDPARRNQGPEQAATIQRLSPAERAVVASGIGAILELYGIHDPEPFAREVFDAQAEQVLQLPPRAIEAPAALAPAPAPAAP